MSAPQQVIKGEAATLHARVPLHLVQGSGGAISSASVVVVGPDGELASKSATRDTATDVLSGAHAEGAETLTTQTGVAPLIVGERYLLEVATREFILVEISSAPSATSYGLAEPLPVDVPADAVLYGTRLSVALTADEVGDNEGFRGSARWTFDTATPSIEGVFLTEWETVKRRAVWLLSADDLTRAYPRVRRLQASHDVDLSELINAARDQLLVPDLRVANIDAALINSPEAMKVPHAAACLYLAALQDEVASSDEVERFRRHYMDRLEVTLEARRTWYDEDDDGAHNDEATIEGRAFAVLQR